MNRKHSNNDIQFLEEEKEQYDLMFQRINDFLLDKDVNTVLPTLDLFLFACKEYGIVDKAIMYGNLDTQNMISRMNGYVDYYICKIIGFSTPDKDIFKMICGVIGEEIFGIYEENKNEILKKIYQKSLL